MKGKIANIVNLNQKGKNRGKNGLLKGNMKGIMFTILTFFLAAGVLMFAMFYAGQKKEKEAVLFNIQGGRLSQLSSEIGKAYMGRMGIVLNGIERTGNAIRFDFGLMFNLSDSMHYQQDLSGLEDFLEGRYSDSSKSGLGLSLSPAFHISYYNISFTPQAGSLRITTDNASALQSIYLELSENSTAPMNSSGFPSDDGGRYPLINVAIRNQTQALLNQSVRLDPSESNAAFYVSLQGGPGLNIYFRASGGRNGTLEIQPNGLRADIIRLIMEYSGPAETVYIRPENPQSLSKGGMNSSGMNIAFG